MRRPRFSSLALTTKTTSRRSRNTFTHTHRRRSVLPQPPLFFLSLKHFFDGVFFGARVWRVCVGALRVVAPPPPPGSSPSTPDLLTPRRHAQTRTHIAQRWIGPTTRFELTHPVSSSTITATYLQTPILTLVISSVSQPPLPPSPRRRARCVCVCVFACVCSVCVGGARGHPNPQPLSRAELSPARFFSRGWGLLGPLCPHALRTQNTPHTRARTP